MQTMSPAPSHQDAAIHWSERDIPLSYGNHRCGRVAWAPEPQSIPVESKLESEVLDYLIHQGHLVAVHSQPFTLSYLDGDRLHRYTPDFLLVYDRLTGQLLRWGFAPWTVVEVKPASYRDSHRFDVRRRLDAVHDQLGFAAVCLTDADLLQGRA